MTVQYTFADNSKLTGFFYTDEYETGKEIFHDSMRVYEYDTNGNPIHVKDIRYPNEETTVCKNHELKVRTDENGVHYIIWKNERKNLEDYDYYDIPTLIKKIEHAKKINDRWYVHSYMILCSLMKNPDKFGVMLSPRYAHFIFPGTSVGLTGGADEEHPIPFIPVEREMRRIKDWHYKIHFETQDPELRQYTASEDYYFNDLCSMIMSGHVQLFLRQTVYNIQWDIDEDTDLEYLPEEIEIPGNITDEEEISDLITELTGFCHRGFQLK